MSISTDWKTLSKKLLIQNKYIELWEDQIQLPNGKPGTYYVTRREPFSVVVPLTDDNAVVLVQQYRYPVKAITWEFPMGFAEGKGPYETAVTELKEETGIEAKEMVEIGKCWHAPGKSNQLAYFYLAKELSFGEPAPEDEEFLEIKQFSIDEMRDMIVSGKILDSISITAFFYLQEYLKNYYG